MIAHVYIGKNINANDHDDNTWFNCDVIVRSLVALECLNQLMHVLLANQEDRKSVV